MQLSQTQRDLIAANRAAALARPAARDRGADVNSPPQSAGSTAGSASASSASLSQEQRQTIAANRAAALAKQQARRQPLASSSASVRVAGSGSESMQLSQTQRDVIAANRAAAVALRAVRDREAFLHSPLQSAPSQALPPCALHSDSPRDWRDAIASANVPTLELHGSTGQARARGADSFTGTSKFQRTTRTPGLSRPMDRLGLSESVPCPVPPVDWLHGAIVHPGGSLLKSLHAHGRDARLEFNAATHVYKVDGLPTLGSVTGVVHAFAHPFDADLIIPRMIHGRRWPRSGYLKDEPPIDSVAAFTDYSEGREILQLFSSEPRDEERICCQAQAVCIAHPELKDAVRGLGLDADAIKDQWDQHRREAANRGTYMHLLFELWLNRCCSVRPADMPGARVQRSHHIGARGTSCFQQNVKVARL